LSPSGAYFLRTGVEDINLSKDQIENIIQLHEHFKHFQSFNITLDENGGVAVKFKLSDLKPKRDNDFVEKLIYS